MTVAPAIAIFLALRAYSVPRIFSIALSLWLLFSSANFPTWPKVSHFALTLLLIGVALSGFFRSRAIKIATLVIATLGASYARPEFFLSAAILGVAFVPFAWFQYRKEGLRSVLPSCLVVVLTCSLAIWHFGVPIGSGSRTLVAFGQHYSLNWVAWKKDKRNPWTNWEAIVRGDFGDVRSAGEALRTNPGAFGHHLFANLVHTPTSIASTFVVARDGSRLARAGKAVGLVLLALAIVSYGMRSHPKGVPNGSRMGATLRSSWFELLALAVLLVPSAISILVVYPRAHYLLVAGTLLAVSALIVLSRDSGERDLRSFEAALLVLGIALLLVQPMPSSGGATSQTNLRCIEFLRSLNIKEKVTLLEAEGGYDIYVGSQYHRVAEYDKDKPWDLFMAEKGINMILLSEGLAKDTRFVQDYEWRRFLDDPSKYGFGYLEIPNVKDRRIIYKKNLMAQER